MRKKFKLKMKKNIPKNRIFLSKILYEFFFLIVGFLETFDLEMIIFLKPYIETCNSFLIHCWPIRARECDML